jgi:putative transposase
MAIEKDLLDQLLAGRDPKDVFNKDGLVDELKKALSERILNAEIDEHLEGEGGEAKGNHRNGYSKKSVLTGTSKMTLSVPRDRAGTFDPKLIAKYQRRFPDFDEKIISMYARGMTVREIRGHLEELYGIDVSPDLISAVTDAVLDEVAEWQNRPLDICYPLVFFDAIRVKVRDEGFVRNKAIYIALGILPDGTKEILGIWIEQTEGAKFWLRVMNELKNRGAQDILIAVVDGLKGFHSDLHRSPDPAFHGFCRLEGSQERRAGAAGHLSRGRRQDRPGRPRRLRTKSVGRKVSGDRAELAPQLGPGHSVLRVSRRRSQNHLHHERHRGAELKAAPGHQNQRSFPI